MPYWGFIDHDVAPCLPDGTTLEMKGYNTLIQSYAYSEELGVLYVHVHKVGGGTLRRDVFQAYLCGEPFPNGNHPHCDEWVIENSIVHPIDVVSHLRQTVPLWFSFVRNPYARAVSSYLHMKKYQQSTQFPTFESFAANPSVLEGESSINDVHYRPQYMALVDDKGHFTVDFIGRLETLERDFLLLVTQLHNVNYDAWLARSGIAHAKDRAMDVDKSHKSWQEYYEAESTKNNIACHYSIDLLLFGYNFDMEILRPESVLPERVLGSKTHPIGSYENTREDAGTAQANHQNNPLSTNEQQDSPMSFALLILLLMSPLCFVQLWWYAKRAKSLAIVERDAKQHTKESV